MDTEVKVVEPVGTGLRHHILSEDVTVRGHQPSLLILAAADARETMHLGFGIWENISKMLYMKSITFLSEKNHTCNKRQCINNTALGYFSHLLNHPAIIIRISTCVCVYMYMNIHIYVQCDNDLVPC